MLRCNFIMQKLVKIYADGGSRGNPGPAASGAVLYDENNNALAQIGTYLNDNTNNYAEYYGLITGLEKSIELGFKNVEVFMDSLLVVKQMTGEYKVKHPNLKPLFLKAISLTRQLDSFKIFHVRREFNKEADAVVNKVLDEESLNNLKV